MSMSRIAATVLTLSATFHYASALGAGCDPRVVAADATFPAESERRGQSGVVVLEVLVGADGRPQGATLQQSSGYRLLDRAATESALKDWQFDVSHCERSDLPASHRIAVEYRHDPSVRR